MSQSAAQPPFEPEGPGLPWIIRAVYLPYSWLVFVPYLAITTALWGTTGILLSFISKPLSEKCGDAWAWLCCLVNFTRVTVTGRDNPVKGQSYVIMCNHQSHFDVLCIYGHLRIPFRWVMKEELRQVPFIGQYTSRMGHVFVDRSNRERAIASLERAKGRLSDGMSVIFFPEGTRSRDGRLKEFKKGGFRMALDLGLPILPVSISGTHRILPGRTFRLLPGHARIHIHAPIETSQYSVETRDQLVANTRTAIASGLTPWERGDLDTDN